MWIKIKLKVEPYDNSLTYLYSCIEFVKKHNPNCLLHVFIHKTDSEIIGGDEKKNGNR